MKQFLEAAQIINKRGLRGELKVDCYCDSLDVLCLIGTLYFDENGKEPVKVISAKPYKGYVYLTLEGVFSAEDADRLRGRILYADRDTVPLEEGRVFIEDLLGLPVIDADNGTEYGKITEVFNRGAGDIYTVSKDGKDFYIPAVKEFIVETDIEKAVYVRPIPGMFDDAEQV